MTSGHHVARQKPRSTALRSAVACFAFLLGAISLALSSTAYGSPSNSAVLHAQKALEQARTEVERLVRAQRELAQNIQALRTNRDGLSSELEARLQESLALQASLEAADADRLRRHTQFLQALKSRITSIDTSMRKSVSQLRTGPLSARKAEAYKLQALRKERASLQAQIEDLRRSNGSNQLWAHMVEATGGDPSDSPTELNEKADFLEDTRDKLSKKRAELLALAETFQQNQRLRNAEKRFITDTQLFDEQARPNRILQPANPGGSSDTLASDAPEDSPVPGHGPLDNPTDDGRSSAFQLLNSQFINPVVTDHPVVRPGGHLSSAPPAPWAGISTAAVPETLEQLLKLDLTKLELEGHTEQLKAILQRLQAAEAELQRSAVRLRAQAKALTPHDTKPKP